MKSPHLLLASSNSARLKINLAHLLDKKNLAAIETDFLNNAISIYSQGVDYYNFARALNHRDWRHIVSRLYYSGYRISRSTRYFHDGSYSTDSSDHKRIGNLPVSILNRATHSNILTALREDRNDCDYDHSILISDLVNTPTDYITYIGNFITDARNYFLSNGVPV